MAVGVLPIPSGPNEVGEILVGIVAAELELPEDDLQLAGQLLSVERGVLERVSQQGEGVGEMVAVDGEGVPGGVVGRVAVDLAAVRLDLPLDGTDRARGRPLEEHMLDDVGDAGPQEGPFGAAARLAGRLPLD